jgi:hypothetical protein
MNLNTHVNTNATSDIAMVKDRIEAHVDGEIDGISISVSFIVFSPVHERSFDYKKLEHYLYLYRGKHSTYEPTMNVVLNEELTHVSIKLGSSINGSVTMNIPFTNQIRKLMYDCASEYLNYHRKTGSIPRLFIETIENDRNLFY